MLWNIVLHNNLRLTSLEPYRPVFKGKNPWTLNGIRERSEENSKWEKQGVWVKREKIYVSREVYIIHNKYSFRAPPITMKGGENNEL